MNKVMESKRKNYIKQYVCQSQQQDTGRKRGQPENTDIVTKLRRANTADYKAIQGNTYMSVSAENTSTHKLQQLTDDDDASHAPSASHTSTPGLLKSSYSNDASHAMRSLTNDSSFATRASHNLGFCTPSIYCR
ncbi:unnamed protein product [Parnassius apollo]|uniref:(apollo) hypothetical protein n=1 Tax=Parnassius apollo TaxID=110799 RepID=A0A8S3XH01_PARAO|nr:unnamed protein product [Parnassius apollo]